MLEKILNKLTKKELAALFKLPSKGHTKADLVRLAIEKIIAGNPF